MKIVISIPAYNEEKNIATVIKEVKEAVEGQRDRYLISVVDDGSKDQTAAIAKKTGALVTQNQRNLGLAETFRREMIICSELKADIIVHIDADAQYEPKEIPKLVNKVKEGYDLVLGSRFRGKIEYMPLLNRVGNKAFSHVISQVTKLKVSDAQTGFRAFTREVAEKINTISTFTYTQEQIIRAAKAGFRIGEVPILFKKRGQNTKSRLMKNPIDFALKAWVNILRIYRDYEPLKFFGFFGGIFFLGGFLLGLWILYTVITQGNVGGLPRVLLTVLFISIGIQILLFGFLADMFRK